MQIMILLKAHFYKLLFIVGIFSFFSRTNAQNTKPICEVYVDNKGVMRFEKTKIEVRGFGVNYTVPFAHAYRSAKRLGIDPKTAIDQDVYHFSRLGFDLFRVHVWDTEISDSLGNLIENEHLDAFDYLLKKLADHGIRAVITPIAFWGNGWPEPDENTAGFSHKYGKTDCLTNPKAIQAQQNYLIQFLNHVNPYTGIAYKDDSNILAFEVSNEPHHKENAESVSDLVKSMVSAMRKTAIKKPILYNISHSVHFVKAYFDGGIQGGTFQWYPTGLGYQQELSGNLLPNVNAYKIPFENEIMKYHGAKIVYEFDAADVGKSYIYPATARSFREAGIQMATHFAYDPTFLAATNTEYNTHYMNLAYAPQKALSLMIAGEVFHRIPMNQSFGSFPQNTNFGDFKVDYLADLAEYNGEEKFIYTNTTKSNPKNELTLKQIVGFGNSTLIEYNGLGAYFLDKIEDGVWRLEIMPDAVWVDNLFGKNSPNKTVAVINWKKHILKIHLKNLSEDFDITAIDEGNDFSTLLENGAFSIQPGTYILSKKGNPKTWTANNNWEFGKLNDFYAPKTTVEKPWFKHQPPTEVSTSSDLTISVQYIAPIEPKEIRLIFISGNKREIIEMKKSGSYMYSAIIPKEKLKIGYLKYSFVIEQNNNFINFPANTEGNPLEWDFFNQNNYQIRIVDPHYPIHLFNACQESDILVKEWRNTLQLVPIKQDGKAEYQIQIEQLFVPDEENKNAIPIYDYSFKHFVLNKIAARKNDLYLKTKLVFEGRALNQKACKLQIAFVLDDGSSFGGILTIDTLQGNYELAIKDLIPVKTVTLPRPYPSFLPYYFEHENRLDFDIHRIESIQFSIGPGISGEEQTEKHGIAIVGLRLE
jgi:hypothetical protein